MTMLEQLAAARGVSNSDVVRMLIRDAHAQQFPKTTKTK